MISSTATTSWDPVWDAATRVDSLGWTAEMRIPLSQLRFSRDSVQTWGMQIWRYVDRLNERDMWSPWKPSDAGGPPYFGHLTGMILGPQHHELELLPYVTTRDQSQYTAPGNPYHSSNEHDTRIGGDLKYLLTSNLTLDATFNPDFGQVEVDPATLNLSAYETFYPEKRPFFVAGNSAFAFGNFSCMFCSNVSSLDPFYSRRIGRQPQLNDYVDSQAVYDNLPDATTIIGAAKVTGRTAGGYTVGLLDAVTNQENAPYRTTADGPELTQQVEPLTNYFVGRLMKDFRGGASYVGGIATSTDRRMDDSVVSDRLRGHAQALGIDWSNSWHGQTYNWMGQTMLSNVDGSPEAITLTEQSSDHYFQRPDRKTHSDGLFSFRYDTTATSMQGYALYTRLAKQSGNWLWETAQNWRSPGFEVNDIGYLDRTDYKWMNFNLARQWTTPGRWYRNMMVIGGGQQQFNYDGDKTDFEAQLFYALQFLNYWNVRTFTIYRPSLYDDQLTRGGPVEKRNGYRISDFEVSTDARSRVVFDVTMQTSYGIDARTHTRVFQPSVSVKPAANIFLSFTPSYDGDETASQYVTTVPDPTATATYGNRYVFGYIRTHTLSLDTRANWTFTPNLTLQLYAQPYIATGDYGAFHEYAGTRTMKTLVYGKDIGSITRTPASGTSGAYYTVVPAPGAAPFTFADPDFTSRSLRGDAVLRWEYRPGSTLFFVWTQERTGNDPSGQFELGHDETAILRDRPTNIFQIKVDYWIGR